MIFSIKLLEELEEWQQEQLKKADHENSATSNVNQSQSKSESNLNISLSLND